jgi:hypothetical protein
VMTKARIWLLDRGVHRPTLRRGGVGSHQHLGARQTPPCSSLPGAQLACSLCGPSPGAW